MNILDFDEMLDYVEAVLIKNNGIRSKNPIFPFRNRFSHIKRVYGWVIRLLEGVNDVWKDAVKTAAIFHDSGYGVSENSHAHIGAMIFKQYASEHNFDKEFTDVVYDLILHHSNKSLLHDCETSIEMIILLEADLLDEEGAMGIVFDLLAEGSKHPESYESVFNEIMKHSAHILDQDFMVTPLGKKYWNEKKTFIREFIKDLKFDLFME